MRIPARKGRWHKKMSNRSLWEWRGGRLHKSLETGRWKIELKITWCLLPWLFPKLLCWVFAIWNKSRRMFKVSFCQNFGPFMNDVTHLCLGITSFLNFCPLTVVSIGLFLSHFVRFWEYVKTIEDSYVSWLVCLKELKTTQWYLQCLLVLTRFRLIQLLSS